MSILNQSKKAMPGQPQGLMNSPRDDAVNHTRRVVKFLQGRAVILKSDEVVSPFQAGSSFNEIRSTPVYETLKCKNKRFLTCPKLCINTSVL